MSSLKDRLGYKINSPFKYMDEIEINSNRITMKDVDIPLEATPKYGNKTGKSTTMYPEKEYHFEGATSVVEKPKATLVLLDHDGKPQMELTGKEIVFSRVSTKRILELAEKAKNGTEDDLLALGKYVYDERMRQKKRDGEI